MTVISRDLIQHQLTELGELRKEANSIATLIANETWDKVELEVEELTEEGVYWDLADHIAMSIKTQIGMMFTERCEHWLGQRFEHLSSQVPDNVVAPDAEYSFYGLLNGLRLNHHLEPRLDTVFLRSKPSFLTIIGRAWIDDVEYATEHMEKDAHKDAARLRQSFYEARQQFVEIMRQAACLLIGRSCHQYAEALKQLNSPSAA